MTQEWLDALHQAVGGVHLDVEVVPGASIDLFPAGYNPWRKRVQAKVKAPPSEGAANEALVALIARVLDVPAARVGLVAGATSRQKRLLVQGLDVAAVAAKLAATFPKQ